MEQTCKTCWSYRGERCKRKPPKTVWDVWNQRELTLQQPQPQPDGWCGFWRRRGGAA